MRKIDTFPDEVLEFLNEMDINDPRLPTMRKLTADKDELKRMWVHLLTAKRSEAYAPASKKNMVEIFLDVVMDCEEEKIPVYYFSTKKKKSIITKIEKAQEKLIAIYEDTFKKEAGFYVDSLKKVIDSSKEKINNCALRVNGKSKSKMAKDFIKEVSERNIWIYDAYLPSVLRSAAMAVFGYNISSDVSVHKLLKRIDEDWCNIPKYSQ